MTTDARGLAYLDASALVKLIRREPESAALTQDLGTVHHRVASELVEVEAMRAVARRAPAALSLAREQVARLVLLPLTPAIRARAAALEPPEVRSLDAIHLATALELEPRLETFYCYDHRLADAARAAGLRVSAPGAH